MFNVDCSFASDSASAMRSSTLPTRFNSLASGVSLVAMVDILKGFVLDFCPHRRSRDSNMGIWGYVISNLSREILVLVP